MRGCETWASITVRLSDGELVSISYDERGHYSWFDTEHRDSTTFRPNHENFALLAGTFKSGFDNGLTIEQMIVENIEVYRAILGDAFLEKYWGL